MRRVGEAGPVDLFLAIEALDGEEAANAVDPSTLAGASSGTTLYFPEFTSQPQAVARRFAEQDFVVADFLSLRPPLDPGLPLLLEAGAYRLTAWTADPESGAARQRSSVRFEVRDAPSVRLLLNQRTYFPDERLTLAGRIHAGARAEEVTAYLSFETPLGQYFLIPGGGAGLDLTPGRRPLARFQPLDLELPVFLEAPIASDLPLGDYGVVIELEGSGGETRFAGRAPFLVAPRSLRLNVESAAGHAGDDPAGMAAGVFTLSGEPLRAAPVEGGELRLDEAMRAPDGLSPDAVVILATRRGGMTRQALFTPGAVASDINLDVTSTASAALLETLLARADASCGGNSAGSAASCAARLDPRFPEPGFSIDPQAALALLLPDAAAASSASQEGQRYPLLAQLSAALRDELAARGAAEAPANGKAATAPGGSAEPLRRLPRGVIERLLAGEFPPSTPSLPPLVEAALESLGALSDLSVLARDAVRRGVAPTPALEVAALADFIRRLGADAEDRDILRRLAAALGAVLPAAGPEQAASLRRLLDAATRLLEHGYVLRALLLATVAAAEASAAAEGAGADPPAHDLARLDEVAEALLATIPAAGESGGGALLIRMWRRLDELLGRGRLMEALHTFLAGVRERSVEELLGALAGLDAPLTQGEVESLLRGALQPDSAAGTKLVQVLAGIGRVGATTQPAGALADTGLQALFARGLIRATRDLAPRRRSRLVADGIAALLNATPEPAFMSTARAVLAAALEASAAGASSAQRLQQPPKRQENDDLAAAIQEAIFLGALRAGQVNGRADDLNAALEELRQVMNIPETVLQTARQLAADATPPAAPRPDQAVILSNAAQVEISGEAEADAFITLQGSDGRTESAPSADGRFRFLLTQAADSVARYALTAFDRAGNASEPAFVEVTVDSRTIPPEVEAPAPRTVSREPAPLVTGAAEPGAAVTITLNGRAVGAGTADGAGRFAARLQALPADGVYTLLVGARDRAGNTAAGPAPLVYILDTQSLTPTLLTPEVGQVFREGGMRISGLGEPGARVVVFLERLEAPGEAQRLEGLANAFGSFAVQAPPDLVEGTYAITAQASDEAGNPPSPRSSQVIITINREGRVAPIITSPSSGQVLSTARPLVSGRARPGVDLELLIDGVVLDSARGDAEGRFRMQPVRDLADGLHTVSVRQAAGEPRDVAGTAPLSSVELPVRIDTAAPAPPRLEAPLQGERSEGTNVTVRGVTEAGATLLLETSAGQQERFSSDAEGRFSFAARFPASADELGITLRARDAAGNASEAVSVTVRRPPRVVVVPIIRSPIEGEVLTEPQPLIRGTAGPNATLRLFVNDAAVATTVAAANGAFTFGLSERLAEGENTLLVQALGAAGEVLAASAPLRLRLDTAPPRTPVLSAPMDGVTIGREVSFLVQGQAEESARVRLRRGQEIVTEQPVVDGVFHFVLALNLLDLQEFALEGIDAAGNVSEPLRFTLFFSETGLPRGGGAATAGGGGGGAAAGGGGGGSAAGGGGGGAAGGGGGGGSGGGGSGGGSAGGGGGGGTPAADTQAPVLLKVEVLGSEASSSLGLFDNIRLTFSEPVRLRRPNEIPGGSANREVLGKVSVAFVREAAPAGSSLNTSSLLNGLANLRQAFPTNISLINLAGGPFNGQGNDLKGANLNLNSVFLKIDGALGETLQVTSDASALRNTHTIEIDPDALGFPIDFSASGIREGLLYLASLSLDGGAFQDAAGNIGRGLIEVTFRFFIPADANGNGRGGERVANINELNTRVTTFAVSPGSGSPPNLPIVELGLNSTPTISSAMLTQATFAASDAHSASPLVASTNLTALASVQPDGQGGEALRIDAGQSQGTASAAEMLVIFPTFVSPVPSLVGDGAATSELLMRAVY